MRRIYLCGGGSIKRKPRHNRKARRPVGNINPVLRQKIENAFLRAKPRVIEDMYSRYGEDPTQVGGGCLFWAAYGADELDKLGIATQVQAGTMFWMTVPRSDISKLSRTRMTNFGYQYGYDNPMSVKNVLEGGIPEMHVWLAIELVVDRKLISVDG